MKKITYLLMLVMAVGVSSNAQDTLHGHDMRLIQKYLVSQWIDSFYYDEYFKVYKASIRFLCENDQIELCAYKMTTPDTIQVYGLAGSYNSAYRYDNLDPRLVGDTSHANAYVYMRLYEAENDSLRYLGEEQMVHLNHTPVSYYIDLELSRTSPPGVMFPPIPMYERYFSAPITVADSFYVGNCYRDKNDRTGQEASLLSLLGKFSALPTVSLALKIDTSVFGTSMGTWYYISDPGGVPFLFPIIAPPDTTIASDTTIINDTTIVSDTTIINDTVIVYDTIINGLDTIIVADTTIVFDTTVVSDTIPGLGIPDLVYRYTAAMPNPATDNVKVTSSFGLCKIEAYDERGRRVYSTPASGMAASLNVSSWRRGVYLLRITTGAGPTTKKLLVR